jgi:hypothetical protein
MIELPLAQIFGRLALPARTFVQIYADMRGRDARPFDLVRLLGRWQRRQSRKEWVLPPGGLDWG